LLPQQLPQTKHFKLPTMAKVSFFLKRPDATTETSIWLLFQCIDGKLKYYTDISIRPVDWNKKDQVSNKQGVNSRVNKVIKAVDAYADKCATSDQEVTKAGLKEMLDRLFEKKNEPTGEQKRENLFDRWRTIVQGMTAGIVLTPKEERYSPGTIRGIKFQVTVLEEFMPKMRLQDVNMDSYKKFILWCQAKKLSTNYIGSIIKNWKTLCHHCGLSLPKEFKRLTEEATTIALSEMEIKLLRMQKATPREAVARDWFILDCYTGLRVSDLLVLASKHYDEERITIVSKKTKTKAVIPAHPLVKEILAQYAGFPPKITDTEINREIKVVAKNAGLTKRIIHSITKGGKKVHTDKQKWEMITNHTARRSFITNLLKNGVADAIVMKLTGIKVAGTLAKYNKVTPEDAADFAQNLPFFQQSKVS